MFTKYYMSILYIPKFMDKFWLKKKYVKLSK